jgi:type I restriction enzyme, S subunit
MSKQSNIPQLRFKGFEGEWERGKLNKFAVINPKNSELPESFIYIDLESVTDGLLVKESTISKNEAPSRAQRILKNKDILYQTVRPYQKNNLYFDKIGNYVASTGYAQIRTKNDSKFLFQFLHTEGFVTNVMLRCTGTSYPAINSSDLSNIEISIPTLPEQEKIASFLSAVDEKIQQLTRKAALLEQYKKGVMQQLFSGKLRFKDENGEEYVDWEEKVLDDVIHFVNGKGHEQNIDDKGSYVVVNSKFVSTDGKVRKYCNTQISPLSKGDIVMVMSDVPNGKALAKCYLIEKNNVYTLNQRICGLKAKKDNSNEFLIYILNRNRYYLGFDSGVGQTNLKKDEVLNCPLFIPTSIAEQQKIAGFLSGIDEKIGVIKCELLKMQGFKKGLLQRMFVS